jgi:uncharacterized membrane protein YfcA
LDAVVLIVVVGAAIAGFAQGVTGFAFALVALSIWSWVIPPELASPMSVFGSLVGMLSTLPLLWHGIDWRRTLPFIAGGLIGIPLGVFVLGFIDPTIFRFGLGLLLVIYCPLMLLLGPDMRLTWGGRAADGAIGWIGGFLGGIAGITGPIPTLWTTIRGWDKDTQRGVLQGFNTSMHAATMIAYGFSGKLVPGVWSLFLLIAPAIVIPAVLGVLLFRRLSTLVFRRVVLVGLIASGVALLAGSAPALFGPA